MIMKAIWNDTIVAESEDTIIVEGNHYFPYDSLNKDYLIDSKTTSICPWKGTASYYSLLINEQENIDAVWYYKDPEDAAEQIKDRVAFWKGVIVK